MVFMWCAIRYLNQVSAVRDGSQPRREFHGRFGGIHGIMRTDRQVMGIIIWHQSSNVSFHHLAIDSNLEAINDSTGHLFAPVCYFSEVHVAILVPVQFAEEGQFRGVEHNLHVQILFVGN